ncbi:MAG: pullulanase-type alpha-1,6-glucosidase [Anaerolinea sp.]|nr:pullulanase-type alpha-1,6-glucosidase [Anaerolinea sp.]
MTIRTGGGGGPTGNIKEAKAHWLTADTIAWKVDVNPDYAYHLHYNPTGGGLTLSFDGIAGGETLILTPDPAGLPPELRAKFPHLSSYAAFKLDAADLGKVRIALKGQVAITAADDTGALMDATGLQIPGVLDDLYAYDGPLGVSFADGVPTLRVWAPTAQSVRLLRFDTANPDGRNEASLMRVDPQTGVWSITGAPEWDRSYYLYEVRVFAAGAGAVVTNLVTDPYSFSLAQNSALSQIVNLDDADLQPTGWGAFAKPPLAAPEDITIYELHIRDFSIYDQSVPEAYRGTYMAFTVDGDGMRHLSALAEAGLTHLHLLPSFDIATINEDAAARVEPDPAELAALPPNSEEQQAIISAIRDQDSFNWGYDPFHYTVPEGSYSTDPNGVTRIIEYRQMIQALNETGLRMVMDVVYNHTNASGQNQNSVLDKIVPGYYHRLSANGRVETSTCCQNTATEHAMMRKLMVDSVVTWAKEYKVDAFRFDLMGHHMLEDMLAVRAALDALTIEADGVDGRAIYLYGEGWNFGEVADNARGVNATQFNAASSGIGTFNDRLRDAVRGGSPFGGQQEQGFINGLYYDPNETDQGTAAEQLTRLLRFADLTRVGLAGNLAEYEFTGHSGAPVIGAEVDYNGSPAGYTFDPQENIVYISKHDNETLFDAIQYKAPLTADMDARVRMHNLGNSIVLLSQGIPFFQAGDDMLRSKSLDRNSYNAGDWFNALDWTYNSNNWGKGLPAASDNQTMWPVMADLLGNPDLVPTRDHILTAVAHFRHFLQIRYSSPLFRLPTAADVQARLRFHNTGPDQIPGVIVMSLSDLDGSNYDPTYALLVALFNANDEPLTFTEVALENIPLELHPVLVNAPDVVKESTYDMTTGTFNVPGRTTAVFVLTDATVTDIIAERAAELEALTPTATPETAAALTTTEPTTTEPAPDTVAEPMAEAEHGDEDPGSPRTGFVIWGMALAVGAIIALFAALLTERRKQQDHH